MVIYLCGLAAAGRFTDVLMYWSRFFYIFHFVIIITPIVCTGASVPVCRDCQRNERVDQSNPFGDVGPAKRPKGSASQELQAAGWCIDNNDMLHWGERFLFSHLLLSSILHTWMHRRVERKDIREPSHIPPPPKKKKTIRKETRKVKTNKKQKQCCCAAVQSELWTPCAGQMGEGMGGWRDEGRLACTRDFLFPPWRTHSLE